ncbi:hypothetical protein OEZ85_006392 [Tetradesmus obliquus]|uniref:FAD/NAD(P)-binding domain-containing protein n=1 Tax=Tetradesmus obliquus TaxID=3088 RepID=A0ABY8TUH1_TETOB|nr:hypothetical protein OEZ85_006392 [Tetradesmus obliquus]
MRHVVIGGGIAGVCCVEELCRLAPSDDVVLISSSAVLKGVDAVIKITKTIEEVLVAEKDLTSLQHANLTVIQASVTSVDVGAKVVHLSSGAEVAYDRLCIAAGARPKVLGFHHERIITLRDTQSVEDFASRLGSARRIAVVGNGGIALELIGAVRDVEVVWVLKHGHIGDAFFDEDAAQFLLGVLQQQQQQQQPRQQADQQPQQHHGTAIEQHTLLSSKQQQQQPVRGHAAGPKWVDQLPAGKLPANVRLERNALVVYAGSEPPPGQTSSTPADGAAAAAAAAGLTDGPWPLHMQLSSGECVGVDLLVQAIGVEPATDWLPAELARAPDGGILVDDSMQSVSVPGVFAAGDCCTVAPGSAALHWFQMRLWSQARLMGCHAAAAMSGALEKELQPLSFELFTHVTRFLGKKVVLLGLYNGQKLQQQPQEDMVMYTRALDEGTADATFVRVLLLHGKMQGVVLIGETDLEETFENLILDGLDLSQFGPQLLDPDIELDHVFD